MSPAAAAPATFAEPSAATLAATADQALEFFRGKGLETSFAWQDMLHEEHDRAFTVAKMGDLDLLADVRDYVDRAISEGWSRQRFVNELRPELVRRGWWGRAEMRDPATGELRDAQLGSVRRLKTIFDTNLRTAYAAGHWARVAAHARTAPYVMYSAILDARTRPLHRAWNGTVLRWDDPWWETHTPPNGWNCRCTVIQLSERDLKKLGKSGPDPAPPSLTREWTNPRTGEVLRVPVGVDPGWGYAPGKSRRQELAGVALDKIAAAPAGLGAAAYGVLASRLLPDIESAFAAWVEEAVARGVARRQWFIAGAASPEDMAFLGKRGQVPQTAEIALEDRLLVGAKARRHGAAGDALTPRNGRPFLRASRSPKPCSTTCRSGIYSMCFLHSPIRARCGS